VRNNASSQFYNVILYYCTNKEIGIKLQSNYVILLLKTGLKLPCMVNDKVLFSTIIKKYKIESDNSTKITIPRDAILVSNSESDFFEVRAYSDRIEVRPHQFKFVGEKQGNTDVPKPSPKKSSTKKDTTLLSEETKSEDEKPEDPVEESDIDYIDNTEEIKNKISKDIMSQLEF